MSQELRNSRGTTIFGFRRKEREPRPTREPLVWRSRVCCAMLLFAPLPESHRGVTLLLGPASRHGTPRLPGANLLWPGVGVTEPIICR